MAYKRNKRTAGETDKADVEGSFSVSELKNPSINEYGYEPYGGHYELNMDLPRIVRVPDSSINISAIFIDPDYFFSPMVGNFEWVQSHPYPLWYTESMSADAGIVSGRMFVGRYDMLSESMSADAGIDSGLLRVLLLTYSMLPESMSADAGIDSGLLRTLLLSYSMLPESMSADAGIDSGVLDTVLIIYSNWIPESMTADMAITGGSLV